MINFEKHIKECLYEFDFFIVPGLGAFIASFRQATLASDGRLNEPFKTFEFNHLLSEDSENKFLSFVSKQERESPAEINSQLNEFIFRLKSSLETNKRVVISQVISFSKSAGTGLTALVDHSVNFYERPDFPSYVPTEVAGLYLEKDIEDTASQKEEETNRPNLPVTSPIIDLSEEDSESLSENNLITEPEQESPEEDSDNSLLEDSEVNQDSRNLYLRYFFYLIPVILIGVALYYVLLEKPFERKNEPRQKELSITEPDTSEVVYVYEDTLAKVPTSDELTSKKKEIPVDDRVTESFDKFIPEKVSSKSDRPKYAYEVAAGLFKNKTNADKLKNKMLSAGFKAEIKVVNGMRRVFVGVNTKEEAEALSQKIESFTGEKSVYFDENGISNK